MRVLVIGGTGVFGSRLALLLHRDGHQVTLAGRSVDRAVTGPPLDSMARLRLDRDGDLRPILDADVEVVVDASGPFQAMVASAEDPWRVPRFCVMHGLHYLDLSDDADFAAGIAALDAAAQAAGCVVLSGVSSVPALSSAAVADLRQGLDELHGIDIAILPGNRAPRGRSVVEAIMRQAGTSLSLWRGGQWVAARNWSDSRVFDLGGGLRRRGWLLRVPDTDLLPHWSGARSVVFRAGMELFLLNFGLSLLGLVRRWRLTDGVRDWQVSLALRFAKLLLPFGTDRGGMKVTVTGRTGGMGVRRSWTPVAEAGEGPFVPTVPARALLRRFGDCVPGARPCLGAFSLAAAEAAMADLQISFHREEVEAPFLFQDALGADWGGLPAPVRELHEIDDLRCFAGRAEVERGDGWLPCLAAFCFRFPPASGDVAVRVIMERRGEREIWLRQFGNRRFRSRLRPGGAGRVWERFGPFDFLIDLQVVEGALHFPVTGGRCLGVPMPRALLPRSVSREHVRDGVFHFDVALYLPLTGQQVVRYRGWLRPEPPQGQA